MTKRSVQGMATHTERVDPMILGRRHLSLSSLIFHRVSVATRKLITVHLGRKEREVEFA